MAKSNKVKKQRLCPECGSTYDNPAPYWNSRDNNDQTLYCNHAFHDPKERLLASLTKLEMPSTS